MSYIPSFVLLLWWYWSAEGIYSGLFKFPTRWDRELQYKSWQLLNMLFKASYWNWVLFLDGWVSSLISLNPTICFLDVLRRKWILCTVLLCGLSVVCVSNFKDKIVWPLVATFTAVAFKLPGMNKESSHIWSGIRFNFTCKIMQV